MKDYSKEEIKEFIQYYKEMSRLGGRLNGLTIGEVFVDENNMIIQNSLEAIKKYKEGVPTEFGENPDSARKVERKISKL